MEEIKVKYFTDDIDELFGDRSQDNAAALVYARLRHAPRRWLYAAFFFAGNASQQIKGTSLTLSLIHI